jgi:hypothetical protein
MYNPSDFPQSDTAPEPEQRKPESSEEHQRKAAQAVRQQIEELSKLVGEVRNQLGRFKL